MQVDDDGDLGVDFTQFAQLMSLNTPLTAHLKGKHGKQPVLQALKDLMAASSSEGLHRSLSEGQPEGELRRTLSDSISAEGTDLDLELLEVDTQDVIHALMSAGVKRHNAR